MNNSTEKIIPKTTLRDVLHFIDNTQSSDLLLAINKAMVSKIRLLDKIALEQMIVDKTELTFWSEKYKKRYTGKVFKKGTRHVYIKDNETKRILRIPASLPKIIQTK